MGMDVQAFLGERDAIVAGWGATEDALSSDILQAARLPFAEKATCEPHYPGQLVDEQVSGCDVRLLVSLIVEGYKIVFSSQLRA